MTMRIFLGVLVILAVLFGVYVYMNPTPTPELTPPTQSTSTPVQQTPTPKPPVEDSNGESGTTMTFNGTLECLPHKGDGPHTMECAYGLKADNGSYYALQNLWDEAPELTQTGVRIRIEGALSDPQANEKYDIKGTIWVVEAVKI